MSKRMERRSSKHNPRAREGQTSALLLVFAVSYSYTGKPEVCPRFFQSGRIATRNLLKQLTEETGSLYDEIVFRVARYEPRS